MRDHNFWVYIITNDHNSVLYIGVTSGLLRRISQHRNGSIAGFTQQYRVHKLIYYEHFREVRNAIAREKQLKRWRREKKVILIEHMNPMWRDLGAEMDPHT